MKEKKIEDFLRELASKKPIPGGGSATALVSAISGSLISMVINLTTGKEEYSEIEEEMDQLLLIINNLELCSESAIDEDGEDFEELMKAWKLPSNTEEEKLIRQKEIEKASRKAAEVPRAVAEASLKILDYSKIIAKKGNKKLISDVLCGAVFAHSSLIASIYNVKINLKSIKDEDYIKKMLSKFENMEQKADEFLKEIREIVDKTL